MPACNEDESENAVEAVNQEEIMNNRRGFTPSGRAGFTLLELLMVVVIIAILAAIALPQYLRVAERSRASEALSMIAAIRSSELRYKAQDPATLYTTVLANLDIEVPVNTPMWAYSVGGTGAGSNAVATRAAGGPGGTVEIDLDTGNTCSANVTYGLPTAAC